MSAGGFDKAKLVQFVEAHECAVRILILKTRGSVPREAGTSMLVSSDALDGTIGGGALEYEAIRIARQMLVSDTQKTSRVMPLGPNLGQCCGGSVELFFEYYDKEEIAILPDEYDNHVRPMQDEKTIPDRMVLALKTGLQDRLFVNEGWVAEKVLNKEQPLWIYGAGHVGRALVSVLSELPFSIVWIDTDTARFPDNVVDTVDVLVSKDPAMAVKHAPDNAIHLVVTYSHAMDFDICHAVLCRDFAGLGLIGSQTKRSRFMKRLANAGINQNALVRLECPIGDNTLGKEPMAIAVGVATKLLKRDSISIMSNREVCA